MEFENKNDKQVYFNQLKGFVTEINEGEIFCSVTLNVGHETKRFVNIVFKREKLEDIKSRINVEDKVCVKYYLSSYNKYDKWKTLAHLLFIDKLPIIA
jgi:molybdopterin-binding protein